MAELLVGEKRKVCGIRRIVRLMGFVRKWKRIARNNSGRRTTTTTVETTASVSPAAKSADCERQAPADVPKGYMGVYVGRGELLRRFIIPTTYLSDPLFKVLLEKVEEEFGFEHRGGLIIPCEIETFKYLLKCMEIHERDQRRGGRAGAAAAKLSVSTAANAA
ncbi:PREDICTED: auxin-responsive protein SAUR50-like [Ipomoea nil]|uniref:auxin-responsive protein SAUR50-like n=1 Tax=Ipomoea nil TaxID=35883 RepID=UPI000900A3FF|nr:PREDICTED: auxin-responsive protein SAUR50-like [Ipomoea nil]